MQIMSDDVTLYSAVITLSQCTNLLSSFSLVLIKGNVNSIQEPFSIDSHLLRQTFLLIMLQALS